MGMLDGKVIVVTGAGGGIGRALAHAIAGQGGHVVVNDVGASLDGSTESANAAETVVREIRESGGSAVSSNHSVSEYDSARKIVETAMEAFGRLDGVVNNAGILRDRLFHKIDPEDFDAVLKVHLYGSFNVSRAAAEVFRQQESGAFVHMTSTSALIGNYGQSNYMAAKLGIVGLSKSIALDLARFNVRSNCIAPFAWSRMTSSIPADTPEQAARVEKIKQMTVDKIAPLTVCLLSDLASHVNAQVFTVRNNEIVLMSQPRPIRSVHRGEGWTPETVAEHALPALQAVFLPLDRSQDVFNWDPI